MYVRVTRDRICITSRTPLLQPARWRSTDRIFCAQHAHQAPKVLGRERVRVCEQFEHDAPSEELANHDVHVDEGVDLPQKPRAGRTGQWCGELPFLSLSLSLSLPLSRSYLA